jgi:hypothetical protein
MATEPQPVIRLTRCPRCGYDLYPSWWRLLGPPLVNARLECGDAQAEAIRTEIQTRIDAAHKEP